MVEEIRRENRGRVPRKERGKENGRLMKKHTTDGPRELISTSKLIKFTQELSSKSRKGSSKNSTPFL